MLHRLLSSLLAALMFLFAYFQLNDPDPALWVVAYSLPGFFALVIGLAKFSVPNKVIWGVMGFYLVGGLFLMPGFVDWGMKGFPSITGSMNYQNTYIELVRELFGIVICVSVFFYQFKLNKKWKTDHEKV